MHNCPRLQISSWAQFVELAGLLSGYVFRGQANDGWPLATSLERALRRYSPVERAVMGPNKEHWMLHQFKKRYHLYSAVSPSTEDNVEWLGLMQHHGAPTRLLDFTASPYVAAHFAVVEAEGDCAIWCINGVLMRDRAIQQFSVPFKHGVELRDVLIPRMKAAANPFIAVDQKAPVRSVIPIEPALLTERMSRQQGLFVMPVSTHHTFVENLESALDVNLSDQVDVAATDRDEAFKPWRRIRNPPPVMKIVLQGAMRVDAMQHLTAMNVHAETLFPGLDGFARSLVQTVLRDWPDLPRPAA